MSPQVRRSLRIDDPVGGEVCHVAHATASNRWMGRLREISLEDVHPNPAQPRKHFNEDSLAALAGSIQERGVLQPIIVQRRGHGEFELIAGERRWRAARIAGLETIAALIADPVDAVLSIEMALIENIARDDLGVIEEARTIAALLDDLQLTPGTLARRLGRSRSDLVHTVRLLELPDAAIDLVDSGQLSKGHGKVLLTEPDHARRRALARRAVDGGWSVRALEAEIAKGVTRRPGRAEPHPDQVAAAANLHDLLVGATGCEVDARPHRRGYRLILDQSAVDRLAVLLVALSRRDDR